MRMFALYRWTSQVIEDGFSDFTICMYSSRYKQYVCVCVGHIHTCGFFIYSIMLPYTHERMHTQGYTNIYIRDNIREILVTSPKVRAILLSQKETSLIRHKFPCIRWCLLCIIAPNSQHMWLTTMAIYYCTCDPGPHHASMFSYRPVGGFEILAGSFMSQVLTRKRWLTYSSYLTEWPLFLYLEGEREIKTSWGPGSNLVSC